MSSRKMHLPVHPAVLFGLIPAGTPFPDRVLHPDQRYEPQGKQALDPIPQQAAGN